MKDDSGYRDAMFLFQQCSTMRSLGAEKTLTRDAQVLHNHLAPASSLTAVCERRAKANIDVWTRFRSHAQAENQRAPGT